MKIVLQLLFLLAAILATRYYAFYSFLIVWAAFCGVLLCDRLVKTSEEPIKCVRFYQLSMWFCVMAGFFLSFNHVT